MFASAGFCFSFLFFACFPPVASLFLSSFHLLLHPFSLTLSVCLFLSFLSFSLLQLLVFEGCVTSFRLLFVDSLAPVPSPRGLLGRPQFFLTSLKKKLVFFFLHITSLCLPTAAAAATSATPTGKLSLCNQSTGLDGLLERKPALWLCDMNRDSDRFLAIPACLAVRSVTRSGQPSTHLVLSALLNTAS